MELETRETCYFCSNIWGSCTCKFTTLHELETDEFTICELNVDESGRFYVDPFVHYGQPFADWVLHHPDLFRSLFPQTPSQS